MPDTLGTLVQEVQYETVQVADPAVGQNFREHIKARINREYRRLYNDFDWPHLREWVDVELEDGARYYDYPDDLALEQVQAVFVKWGGQWTPLDRGIRPTEYNAFDSDLDARSDPTQRWAPYGREQFEVWPIPASDNTTTLRFGVKRAFTPLVDESDLCDLDTDLIVLFSAAHIMRRYDDKEAALVMGRAMQHYETLKLRGQTGRPAVNFTGGPATPRRGFADKVIVGVSGA
jgi:hypothetical protein